LQLTLQSFDHSPAKLTNARKNRPGWAKDDKSFMQHVLGPSLVRRIRIAYLYWRQNWTAREIAEELGCSVNAVKQVIKRTIRGSLTDTFFAY
jgi:DNA-directed RNA polymerase specialized sigma subunit